MKLSKEEYALIYNDVLAKAQYLETNATPLEIESGLLASALAARQKILKSIEALLAPEKTDKTPIEKSSPP